MDLPKSITIIGGGVIGAEYASILATMGLHVTLIERRPRLLEFVDQETIEALQVPYAQYRSRPSIQRRGRVCRADLQRTGHRPLKERERNRRLHRPLFGRLCLRASATLNLARPSAFPPMSSGRLTVNEALSKPPPHTSPPPGASSGSRAGCRRPWQGRWLAACAAPSAISLSDPIRPAVPYGIYSIPEIFPPIGRNETDPTENEDPYAVGMARCREVRGRGIIGERDRHVRSRCSGQQTRRLTSASHADRRHGVDAPIHIGQTVMTYHQGQIRLTSWMRVVQPIPTLAEVSVRSQVGLISSPDPGSPDGQG